tara:strand:+ start:2453 stop:2665 length:213 start_codon:yes stop_codon:yes gene_type:complete
MDEYNKIVYYLNSQVTIYKYKGTLNEIFSFVERGKLQEKFTKIYNNFMDTNKLHPYDALMETYNSLKEDS